MYKDKRLESFHNMPRSCPVYEADSMNMASERGELCGAVFQKGQAV